MDVLISWSGRQSRRVAEELYVWLPKVLPKVKPWISTQDIDKGKRWFDELQKYLATAKACIVCLTPENVNSPWLYWETGAIALTQKNPICPLLIGIAPSDIDSGPLKQFQCTYDDEEDVLGLVRSLNNLLDPQEDPMRLKGVFATHWGELHSTFVAIAELSIPPNLRRLVEGLKNCRIRWLQRWGVDSTMKETVVALVSIARNSMKEVLEKNNPDPIVALHWKALDTQLQMVTTPSALRDMQNRGAAIPEAFDKTIEAILAEYSMPEQ